MVARNTKSESPAPYYNVHVELDNRALKAKNNGLTQSVAKLQQENAELLKQRTMLQEENFEISSKYINLRNVMSIIESTSKACLPKLTEFVDTFTSIIQLCSVAANISKSASTSKDTRTQAVKPQIVNGHVLHNPTITLSRFDNEPISFTPERPSTSHNASSSSVRPSTSRSVPDSSSDRHVNMDDVKDDSNSESDEENTESRAEEQNISIRCNANRGLYRRKQKSLNNGLAELEDDTDSSEEELEMSDELETPTPEENEDDESDQRLPPILEEEEEEYPSPLSPNSTRRTILQGRLQEVRIYLNQLPDTYVQRFTGSGNISISVSPPERRSSYKYRSSSLVGEATESNVDNESSFLDETVSPLNTTIRVGKRDRRADETFSFNSGQSKVNVSFKSPTSARPSAEGENRSAQTEVVQFFESFSPIPSLSETPSTSRLSGGNTSNDSSTLKRFDSSPSDTQDKINTSTSSNKSKRRSYDSLNKSPNSSLALQNHVTKRKNSSREKRKVAQVLLKRLSMEKRRSGSPIKKLEGIVNTPPMTTLSEIKTRLRSNEQLNETIEKSAVHDNRKEKSPKNAVKTEQNRKKTKKDSPTQKAGSLKKSPGRPKRAARPTAMKEPSLVKKLRRSK